MKRFAACMIAFALLLSSVMSVAAEMAYPGPYYGRQPSGERFVYTVRGDENWEETFSGDQPIIYNRHDGYWYYTTQSERYRLRAVRGMGLDPAITFDHYDPTDPKYIAFMKEYPAAIGYYLYTYSDKRFLIDVPDEVYYYKKMHALSEDEKDDIRQMNATAAAALEEERKLAPKNIKEVWETILSLPGVNELTLADAPAIDAVSESYDLLDDEEKDIIPQTVRLKLTEVKDGMKRIYNYEQNILGDANYDGTVDISDIFTIKNAIMCPDNGTELRAADIDKDGKITVADILAVKNIIMSMQS